MDSKQAAQAIASLLSPPARKAFLARVEKEDASRVYATRLTDGKPVTLYPGEIRYGRPTDGHTLRTGLLKIFPAPGLLPYEAALLGRKFAAEIRIETAGR